MAETSLLLFMELAVISKILTLIFKYDKIMEIINGTEDILCSENRLEGQKIIARYAYYTLITMNRQLFLRPYYYYYTIF